MSILEQLVKSAAELGAAHLAESLGLTPGEMSQREVLRTYGKWAADAIRDGRLRPSRTDDGRNGTKRYRVVEITNLRTADLVRAELQLTGRKTL
jgi:hypothetical protein